MLSIKEFDFSTYSHYLALYAIDTQIRKDLRSLITCPLFYILRKDKNFLAIYDKLLSAPSYTMLSIKEINTLVSDLKGIEQYYELTLGPQKEFILFIDKYSRKKKFESSITFKELLLDIFDYATRRESLILFFSNTQLTNCLYCLAQNTITYINKKDTLHFTGTLDHIRSHKKYPYLSVTLNNLIPCCSHCNSRKSDSPFTYNPINNQVGSHLQSYFDFGRCISIQSVSGIKLDLSKMEFTHLVDKDLKDKLDLLYLYRNYSFILENILERYVKFTSSAYKHHLQSIKGLDENFDTAVEFFISEVAYSEANLVSIPLHKFKSDFYKYLKSLANTP